MGKDGVTYPQWENEESSFLESATKIDNGFILFDIDKIIGVIHHGFCNWKNQFKLEIYGSKGFLKVSSLSKWGNVLNSRCFCNATFDT